MPSPLGHLLAGVAVAWTVAPRADRRLTLTSAVLAAAPDLDLLLPIQHRTVTHSVGAVAAVTIVATVVTGKVTFRTRTRVVAICALAVASHVLMDWMGADPVFPHGLQALWPFSDRFFISGWDVFVPTARTEIFTRPMLLRNLGAAVRELTVMLPIVLGLWLVRIKTLARLSSQVAGRNHPA